MPRKDTIRWKVPVRLSKAEEAICKRCTRTGRLFSFLRRHRHELFPDEFQAELAELYADSPLGKPPLPPAMLAMVTLLQAAEGASDAVAVEEALFNRRWQMVLGCLSATEPPFSQGVLVDFRLRLVDAGLHHRLVEQSVAVAKATGSFGFKQLKVALDSAPLWGAGRVEDTFNLIGHAMEVVVVCAAAVADCTAEEVRDAAKLELLGKSSLKAALDIDWDDREEQHRALQVLIAEVEKLRTWLVGRLGAGLDRTPLKEALEQLERVLSQDLEPDPDRGGSRIARGTAKDRQISISDPEMRHGRKSRSRTIEGYKRFIARELDHGLILGVAVQPANRPEHEASASLRDQVGRFGETASLHIDRGFLSGEWTKEAANDGIDVLCRPWRARNGTRFAKHQFRIDLHRGEVTCPANEVAPIRGSVARFPARACGPCPKREACTRAAPPRGRTISLHPQEALLQRLAKAKATPEGRGALRERTPVEHGLAHICNRQGRRARYRGVNKNVFDLCRYAVIENLFVADRAERAAVA